MTYYVELPDSNSQAIQPSKPKTVRSSGRNRNSYVSNPVNHILAPVLRGAAEYYQPHLETLIPAIDRGARKVAKKIFGQKTTTPQPRVVYKASGEVVAPKRLQGTVLPTASGSFATYSPTTDFKYIKTVPETRYVMSARGKNAMSSTTVSAPVARSKRVSAVNRVKYSNGPRGVVLTHKELIGSLESNATTLSYNAVSFVLNPGKSGTFPWLSTIASNYDKYRILSLRAHFVSNQPTSTAGRIGVGIDYDSTDPLPADRTEFFALTHHVESSPWDSVTLNVPVKSEIKFVNSHSSTDSKLIDYGQLIVMADQIVTSGSAILLGDVIIEYTVELIDPQQATYSTQYFVGNNIGAFSALVNYGHALAEQVSTTSTTVVEYTLPAGFYAFALSLRDTAAGTPGMVATINGGTGTNAYTGDTTERNVTGKCKITSNTGKLKITLSTVALANLEYISFMFTRISSNAYAASAYATALGTY